MDCPAIQVAVRKGPSGLYYATVTIEGVVFVAGGCKDETDALIRAMNAQAAFEKLGVGFDRTA